MIMSLDGFCGLQRKLVENAYKDLTAIDLRNSAPPSELYDAGDDAFVSLEIDGLTGQGYDRCPSRTIQSW